MKTSEEENSERRLLKIKRCLPKLARVGKYDSFLNCFNSWCSDMDMNLQGTESSSVLMSIYFVFEKEVPLH